MSKKVIITESQLKRVIAELTNKELAASARETNTNPTIAQKECGNYKKAHVNILGFNIAIENPRGTYRRGVNKDGKEWKIKMPHHYGYFNRTVGKDGDQIDVFIGTDLKSDKVFVVDQVNGSGEFDESKVMLCFCDEDSAKKGYMDSYSKGWNRFKKITGVSIDFFKEWLYDGHRQKIPFYQYVAVKQAKL